MIIEISTPALLFPAVSLLFLAYTNRFLHLATLVRNLHADWQAHHNETVMVQINNLKSRLHLIRWMQLLGALSLLCCTLSMLTIMLAWQNSAFWLFFVASSFMLGSLTALVVEVAISGGALKILLSRAEEKCHLKQEP